jgi:hypothetical protein
MDGRSRSVLAEFAVILVVIVWAAAISWAWPAEPPRDVDLVLDRLGLLCLVAAACVGILAYRGREPIGESRLTRWDEAVGFYGVECLADLAVLL